MKPLIIVDENIPFGKEAFSLLGDVKLLPGRQIASEHVKQADALIVRSITKVNEKLLLNSSVRFVGTATIGFDHVDLGYLKKQNITFASAPGSNANSVSEYIIASLLLLAEKKGKTLASSSLAIIGVGNVGSRVLKKAQTLGMTCLLNDPPKQRETFSKEYLPLQDAIANADFVSLHVPLKREGIDMTFQMADKKFFSSMKKGAAFLNSSRGEVAVEKDLQNALSEHRLSDAVMDVWQNEPDVDPDMVNKAFVATPHIAGYSFDGKVNGTLMMFNALKMHLDSSKEFDIKKLLPLPEVPEIDLTAQKESDEKILLDAALWVYDIKRDDRDMRKASMKGEKRGTEFDRLRKEYPRRREFQNTTLILQASQNALIEKAKGLGFKVKTPPPKSP